MGSHLPSTREIVPTSYTFLASPQLCVRTNMLSMWGCLVSCLLPVTTSNCSRETYCLKRGLKNKTSLTFIDPDTSTKHETDFSSALHLSETQRCCLCLAQGFMLGSASRATGLTQAAAPAPDAARARCTSLMTQESPEVLRRSNPKSLPLTA